MLDYILNTAQAFEREHGIAPDIIYINPMHYERLNRYSPGLFAPGNKLEFGFRLVTVCWSRATRICRGGAAVRLLPGYNYSRKRVRLCGLVRWYWLVVPVGLLSACGAWLHRMTVFSEA